MTLQGPEAIRPAPSSKARELMEEINTDAGKDNIWVRTQMNCAGAAPVVHRHRRRHRHWLDGVGPRRRRTR